MSEKITPVHIAAKLHFVPKYGRAAKEYAIDNVWRCELVFTHHRFRERTRMAAFRVAEGASTVHQDDVDARITLAIPDDLPELKTMDRRSDFLLMEGLLVIAIGREWEYIDELGLDLNQPF